MVKVNKLVLGIRTSLTMFRVAPLSGQIIDEVLSCRGKKPLDDEYYSDVATNLEQGFFMLQNLELGNTLHIDKKNIVFIKDGYEQSNKDISLNKAINEFSFVWNILNERLKVRDIRRIGIVAEHQVKKNNGSKVLIESFTSLSLPPHPAKFHLKYEERKPTKEGLAPDIEKDDFMNVIYSFYDSEIDTEHPTPDAVNLNIDVQRYYSPLISSNVSKEISNLSRQFENEEKKFISLLKEKGLV